MTHARVDAANTASPPARGDRMPSLGGIRGLAILAVLVSHLYGGHPTLRRMDALAHVGELGVAAFFVLSGFLVTSLLINEQRQTGGIAVGRFLVRRAFRIFPAAYAFFLFVAVASAAGLLQLHRYDLVAALTYTMNFDTSPAWWLGHTWSLSVEEQFYLVWPLILYVARPPRGVMVALAAVLILPLVRLAVVMWFPGLEENFERTLLVAIDGFAIGSLLVVVRTRLEANATYVRWIRTWWVCLLLPLAALAGPLEHHPLFFYGFVQSGIYLALAICLHRSLLVTDDVVGRLLNWAPLEWLGSISYSLYLWQQLFLAPNGTGLIHLFPFDILLSLLCAVASYHLIERPFLGLRDRLWPARVGTAPGDTPPLAVQAIS